MSKSPSLRRIQADVRELALDPSDRYIAAPLEDDMFEWHFTIRGADGTDFEGGIYHGRILLPPEYPFKPPHILFLTPSGRFDTNTKICLSFSAFHPELWQPAWGIRLILEALIAFLPSPADGAIGALDWTPEERKRLAKKSVSFCCPRCGKVASLLPEPASNEEKKPSRFQKEIEQLRLAQISNETKDADIKKGVDDKVSSETLPLTLEQGTPPSTCPVPQTPDPATPVATPMEPTQDTATGARIMEEHNPTAPAVEEAEQENPYEVDLSWLTDPMLNVSIVLLSAICVLLVRKAHALLDELSALDAGRS